MFLKEILKKNIWIYVSIFAVAILTALSGSQVFYDGGWGNTSQSEQIWFGGSVLAKPKEYCFDNDTYNDNSLKVRCYTESIEIDGKMVIANFADVQVSSSDQLCTAFAGGKWKSGIRSGVTEIAWENNAVVAVNGDNAYDGVVISNGSVLSRNPKNIDLLLVDSKGDFVVFNDREFTRQGLIDSGAYLQSFSFGPVLTQNGEISIGKRSVSCSPDSLEARTAIGQIGERNYLLCTIQKSSDSAGVTIKQLAGLMNDKGCETSYNLCGGRQSDMSFHNMRFGIKNTETPVGNIVYFASASDELEMLKEDMSDGE